MKNEELRNKDRIAAHLRGGAGAHGGRSKKERRKRERRSIKQVIKDRGWDG